MIYFLFGKDSFRLRKKLKEIVNRYRQDGFFLRVFNFLESTFTDFKKELSNKSLLKEKRVFVLEQISSVSEIKEEELTQIEKAQSDILIFIEEKEIDPHKPIYSFLLKKAKLEEFEPLDKYNLRKWAKEEFLKYHLKIQDEVLVFLLDYIGSDLWSLSTEILKLSSFKNFKGEIRKEDIEKLATPYIDSNIFKVIDSILSRNKKKALKLLLRYLEKEGSPFVLFTTLSSYLENILSIKDSLRYGYKYTDLFRQLKIHPFVIKKGYQFARRYSFPELIKNYQKVFVLDSSIKRGQISPNTALSLLLSET